MKGRGRCTSTFFLYFCAMENFQLNILGAGSAVPTKHFYQPSQLLSLRDKMFMIDCGEGTQNQIRRFGVGLSRLNHIFISHLHGDHCFGLIGLLSTLDMQGRTSELTIHSHEDLQTILTPLLSYFCKGMTYKVKFESFDPKQNVVIYDDKSLTVETIPLKHKIPTAGFLFKEKDKLRHIIREKVDFYKIPVKEIPLIKAGADYFCPESGELIPNSRLTTLPTPSKSYAYCSDSLCLESILPIIERVDCLFHEATFLHQHLSRAKVTFHSTAQQVGMLAERAKVGKLIIGHYSARYNDVQPLLNEVKQYFPNTYLASDGAEFLI